MPRIRQRPRSRQSLLVGVVNTADWRWRSAPASRIEKTKTKFSRRADPEKPHIDPYPRLKMSGSGRMA
jgi:hypothetical protein